MKTAKKKPRRKLPVGRRQSVFEVLEHRRMLTVYSDLANKLTAGSLAPVQTNLESALNGVSKIPLLTQAAGSKLGDFSDVDIITKSVIAKLDGPDGLKAKLAAATDDASA